MKVTERAVKSVVIWSRAVFYRRKAILADAIGDLQFLAPMQTTLVTLVMTRCMGHSGSHLGPNVRAMHGAWPCSRRRIADQVSYHGTGKKWGHAWVITYPVAGCWPNWRDMYYRSSLVIVTSYVILRDSHAEDAYMHQVISLRGVYVLPLSLRAVCSEGSPGLVSWSSFSWGEGSSYHEPSMSNGRGEKGRSRE